MRARPLWPLRLGVVLLATVLGPNCSAPKARVAEPPAIQPERIVPEPVQPDRVEVAAPHTQPQSALLPAAPTPPKAPEPQGVPDDEAVLPPTAAEPAAWSKPVPGQGRELDRFYRALADMRAGRRAVVRVLQLGDSHTAGDVMTSRLRSLLQQQFGDGGRGMMVPGIPYNGLRQVEVKTTQTGRWSYANAFKADNFGPWGLSGFRATGRGPGASLSIEDQSPEGFARVQLGILRGPGRGVLDLRVDGRPLARIATDGKQVRRDSVTIEVPPGSRRLDLVVTDRAPVELLSWTLERKRPGVVFDSFGISGATAGVTERFDPGIMASELAERSPSLVILAYGTNEGFAADLNHELYAPQFDVLLRTLRHFLPDAAFLVMTAPDGNRLDRACGGRGGGFVDACRPEGDAPGLCAWRPPGALRLVRHIHSYVARRQGALFWDWSALMGGLCGIHRWVLADPPLARADHVHLTHRGYEATGDALYETLMRGWDDWVARGSPGLRPASPAAPAPSIERRPPGTAARP